ncbi:MAG: ABC transporter ATP-binding protein [Oligoflexales bacterium]
MNEKRNSVVLQAQGLVKKWGQETAVNRVNLTLQAGRCLALLGPNGAGKTTTCEILEGLNVADSGTIEICGLQQPADRDQILHKIGVQLQETHLYKKYTVEETLRLFASFYKETQPVNEILKQMQLEEKRDARLETLSGGQKQRVYLGCALVHNPSILFLDEPTTGLDPQSKRMIWDLLKHLLEQGRSLLLTTHSMEEAEFLAHQVAIMDHGEVIAQGTAPDLIKQHANGETLTFQVDAENFALLHSRLSWVPKEGRGLCRVVVSNASQHMLELVKVCHEEGVKLTSLGVKSATLEDVFLNLTGRGIRDA